MTDEEFINTPSPWETESESEFLRRLLAVIDSDERSSMQTSAIRMLVNERLDPEFAKYERQGLVPPFGWGGTNGGS